MQSRIRLLGHPIHPMLVVLPLGLLGAALLFDVVYLVTGDEVFAEVAYWDIALGIVGGLAAAVFGLYDLLAIDPRTRARRVGLVHGGGNVLVLGLFAWSWWLRVPEPAYLPDALPFLLAAAGLGIALATAWLGGELVYRLRIGVDDDAHPNASSSLAQGLVTATPPDESRARGVPGDPRSAP
jgi:uncharacterized membrane protein